MRSICNVSSTLYNFDWRQIRRRRMLGLEINMMQGNDLITYNLFFVGPNIKTAFEATHVTAPPNNSFILRFLILIDQPALQNILHDSTYYLKWISKAIFLFIHSVRAWWWLCSTARHWHNAHFSLHCTSGFNSVVSF